MSRDAATAVRQRGRPRSEKAHHAILQAAAELLLEQGLDSGQHGRGRRPGRSEQGHHLPLVAHQRIPRAGCALPRMGRPPAGPGHWIIARRPAHTSAPVGPAGQQATLRARNRRAGHRGPDRPGVRPRIPRALRPAAPQPGPRDLPPRHDRGEIPPQTNIEVALDLLYGPIYHRLLHGHAPLNDRFVRDVIDTALHGIAPVTSKSDAT